MIVCDTSLVSELMKPVPNSHVAVWQSLQSARHIYLTTISVMELSLGAESTPADRGRDEFKRVVQNTVEGVFRGRVLPFGAGAARCYGRIMLHRQGVGRPIGQIDCLVAAIARSWGASLATRSVENFLDCGIQIIDPWADT